VVSIRSRGARPALLVAGDVLLILARNGGPADGLNGAIELTVLSAAPAQALVPGTTKVAFSGAATGFGGGVLTSPSNATLS
jgi:hypothetical protein